MYVNTHQHVFIAEAYVLEKCHLACWSDRMPAMESAKLGFSATINTVKVIVAVPGSSNAMALLQTGGTSRERADHQPGGRSSTDSSQPHCASRPEALIEFQREAKAGSKHA